MAKSELLPQVDETGKVIGKHTRDIFHSTPSLIHPTVHCWVFNYKGQVLWQQRSVKKDAWAGYWDVSCGGHVAYGEDPSETMIRELKEELHIDTPQPIFVGTHIARMPSQTEFIYIYYIILDKETEEFELQTEEVEKVQWFDIYEAQMLFKEGKVKAIESIITEVSKILQFVFKNSLI